MAWPQPLPIKVCLMYLGLLYVLHREGYMLIEDVYGRLLASHTEGTREEPY